MEFCNASILQAYGVSLEKQPLELLWSFVVSIFLIGAGIGAFLAGSLANRIGRRNAIFVNGILNVIGAIIFGFCILASSVELLLFGRLVVGLAGGNDFDFFQNLFDSNYAGILSSHGTRSWIPVEALIS